MNSESIRVIIVDDHPVVRTGLRGISEVDPALAIVAEAANGAELMRLLKNVAADLVLLDVRLPDRGGIELCAEIKSAPRSPKVLFLTSFADDALVLSAIKAGADGYLLKDSDHPQIAAAIRKACAGGVLFDPATLRRALSEPGTPLSRLSPQEQKVLEQVSLGRTDKEVASALGLTPKTARNYLDRVFEKLGVSTRTEAARAWFQARH